MAQFKASPKSLGDVKQSHINPVRIAGVIVQMFKNNYNFVLGGSCCTVLVRKGNRTGVQK